MLKTGNNNYPGVRSARSEHFINRYFVVKNTFLVMNYDCEYARDIVNIILKHPATSSEPDHSPALGSASGVSTGGIRLTLYGALQVRDASGNDATPRIRKSRAVLAVLAMAAPKPVLRDQLANLLWSSRDRDQGRIVFRDSCLIQFVAPHGACFDHAGNIFVVEWVEVGRTTKLRKLA